MKLLFLVIWVGTLLLIGTCSRSVKPDDDAPDYLVDARDGRRYRTVTIGSQVWMAENLNVGTAIDSSESPMDNALIEKWVYKDNPVYADTFGGLYNWYEAMGYAIKPGVQGICPAGWHLPADDEWKELELYLGIPEENVNDVYSRRYEHWEQFLDGGATGLDMLLSGYLMPAYAYGGLHSGTMFWSSSSWDSNQAWIRGVYDCLYRDAYGKTRGFCVRCVKGEGKEPETPAAGVSATSIASRCPEGGIPIPVEFTIRNLGDGTLYYHTESPAWAACVPDSGASGGEADTIKVQYSTEALSAGTYHDSIIIGSSRPDGEGTVLYLDLIITTSSICAETLVDVRDNRKYATVYIGSQCWMAENLNVGEIVPGDSSQRDNGIIEKYAYGDDPANCDTLGGLYQWDEAMGYTHLDGAQGICPEGWHIPSDHDWFVLEAALGMDYNELALEGARGLGLALKLKPGGETGFNAVFSGMRSYLDERRFSEKGNTAFYWSSTMPLQGFEKWIRYFYNITDYNFIMRNSILQNYGYCVRCVRD